MRSFLRFMLLVCLAVAVAGAGFALHRYLTRHVTIRIAVANMDGDDAQLIIALNRWLTANNRRYRLRPVAFETIQAGLQAAARGEIEAASARADTPMPSGLASSAVLYKEAGVFVAAPQSGVTNWATLRGRTIGVVGKTTPTDPLLLALLRLNGVADVRFVPVAIAAIDREIQRKAIQGVAYVEPLAGASLNELRAARPMRAMRGEQTVLGFEDAEAAAKQDRRYADYDIPPGALRAAPPLPAETVSTLAVARLLVGRRGVPSFFMSRFLAELMEARRGVLAEAPLASQIGAPDAERDAPVPVHAGASAYFSDEEPSLWDTLTEWIYLAPMIAGGLGTFGVWLSQRLLPGRRERRPLVADFILLRRQASGARTLDDLAALDRRMDALVERLGEELAAGELSEQETLSAMFSADVAERKLREARVGIVARA